VLPALLARSRCRRAEPGVVVVGLSTAERRFLFAGGRVTSRAVVDRGARNVVGVDRERAVDCERVAECGWSLSVEGLSVEREETVEKY